MMQAVGLTALESMTGIDRIAKEAGLLMHASSTMVPCMH